MTRKFLISFIGTHYHPRGEKAEIVETTYEIDGLVNMAVLEEIRHALMEQFSYMHPPKILGLFELEEEEEE